VDLRYYVGNLAVRSVLQQPQYVHRLDQPTHSSDGQGPYVQNLQGRALHQVRDTHCTRRLNCYVLAGARLLDVAIEGRVVLCSLDVCQTTHCYSDTGWYIGCRGTFRTRWWTLAMKGFLLTVVFLTRLSLVTWHCISGGVVISSGETALLNFTVCEHTVNLTVVDDGWQRG
jgi:hypothetical protein